jgi:hypothetical protein
VGVVPPRVLDREIDSEPVWRTALRVRDGLLPEETWERLGAMLSAADADDLAQDLVGPPYPYHLSRRWVDRFASGYELSVADWTSFEALALVVLRRLPTGALEAWVRDPSRLQGQLAAVVDAWTERCAEEGRVPDPTQDGAVAKVVDATHLDVTLRRRVLGRIPAGRREAIALSIEPNLLVTQFSDGQQHPYLRGSLAVTELAPTAAVRDRILAHLATSAYLAFDLPAVLGAEIVDALLPALRVFGPDTATKTRAAAGQAAEAQRGMMAAVLSALADRLA